jgi:hypothetical protein
LKREDAVQIDDRALDRVREAILDCFGQGMVADVRVDRIEILEEDDELRIVFTIETDADPRLIGRRSFGLTDKVRKALGEEWRGYFPILQSEIHRGVAA